MAYGKDGYPTELANKVGHVKLIQDPMIQRMIESFEDSRPSPSGTYPNPTGCVELSGDCPIKRVVTIDGGHQAVPNLIRPERQAGFVQIAVQLVKMETVEYLRDHPMADPRDVQGIFNKFTHHIHAVVPLTGMNIPGLTVRDSIREVVHRFVKHYELYPAMSYLVYRAWEAHPSEIPSMHCLSCGQLFELPRFALVFPCSRCGHDHKLSDYLGLCDQDSPDRSTAETVSNLRSVLEALALFSLIVKFRGRDDVMGNTLYLLDGPLLLRAQLSRLVEPIRSLTAHQHAEGRPLFLVGVEKSGEFRNFADSYSPFLKNPGEYFLPDAKFIVEEINGRSFTPDTYRNRVNYGSKVVARLGPHHVMAMDVPTGEFLPSPRPENLVGFEDIVRCLSRLLSYSYPNALMPIVLANSAASISYQPSGGILAQFVERILHGER